MIGIDLIFLALALLTASAAVSDWRTGHIPNALCATGCILGSVLHILLWVQQGPALASLALRIAEGAFEVGLGLGLAGIGPYVLFRIDAMGGGDVKLLGAIGATAGPALGLQIELYALILMALYAPVRMASEGQLGRLVRNTLALLVNPLLPGPRRRRVEPLALTSLVFAPAIFLATLLSAATSGWQP